MPGLPIMLEMSGRRVLIVGGGGVALRRATACIDAGAVVTVVAPQADPGFTALNLTHLPREYQPDDLNGMQLVVIATDDPKVNTQVAAEAAERGILINRADDPKAGDLSVLAHRRVGPITVAVSTDGVSASAARVLVDQCANVVDEDWVTLLEAVGPYRELAQQRIADDAVRLEALRKMTDINAMTTLKTKGPEALDAYLRACVDDA